MKKTISSLLLGLFILLLESCESKPVGIQATGVSFEVVVVAEKKQWDGLVGEVLKSELLMSIPGLPQSEPSMRITYVTPADFNGMMTYVRNILIVNIEPSKYTKVSLNTEKDRWANGQSVVYVNAPSEDLLVNYLNQNEGILVDYYTRVELQRMSEVQMDVFSTTVMEKVKGKFGVLLNVPSDMNSYKDTIDFFWTSNNANRGRMDVAVYSFPYTDPSTFTLEYLLAKRDSALGQNIPGSFPNSYMSTSSSSVTYTPITLYGKYCGVLRGLWEMKGDMMGGPFISYARLDEANNRIIVAEGFVYAPESDKRNYIRRLEAALHTLRFPAEENLQPSEQITTKENTEIKD